MKLEYLDFEYSDARKKAPVGAQNINTSIDLTSAELKDNLLLLDFVYTATYAPSGSYIRIGGKASFSGPEIKSAHTEWTRTKRITGTPGEGIINAINYSTSINSVFIARVFNMTPPLMPPTIKFKAPEATTAPKPRK